MQIHVEDAGYDHEAFRPWRVQALAFKALRRLQPDYALWRDFAYEYEHDRLAIDLINGSDLLRRWVDDRDRDAGRPRRTRDARRARVARGVRGGPALSLKREKAGQQSAEVVMRRDAAIRRIVALHTPGLRAEIREKRALLYGTDPGAASGIASHVRAASAIRRQGTRLIVMQDDVNALAVMDASGCVVPLLLPPGTDGRRWFDDTIGNKHLKMDLEAAVVLPDARVLAFGSGSTRARERIVVVESETGVQVRRAPGFYSRLRKHCETVGTELNIEGAVLQGHRLRLFQRGNGARVTGGRSGSLVFDVDLARFLRWLASRGPVPA